MRHLRSCAVAAVVFAVAVVWVCRPVAAQAPTPQQTPEEIKRRIDEIERTIEAQGAQRERVLASLDEVEAQVADLSTQVARASVDVAHADSALEHASGEFGNAARELYKNPQRPLVTLLAARSLNEAVLARKYLATRAHVEADAFTAVRESKADKLAQRDKLASKREELRAAHAKKYEFRDAIDESVAQEQALLAALQRELEAAAASAATADLLAGLPPATLEDCPGSGAGAPGGDPKANAAFSEVYSKYPFGPVTGIPAGFQAVGPRTSEVHSWYGACFHGHSTASGAVYDQNLFTAAALKYPLGTFLVVTNPANSRSILVYINDRGPYAKGRTLDLSAAGAAALGTIDAGVAAVEAQVVRPTY